MDRLPRVNLPTRLPRRGPPSRVLRLFAACAFAAAVRAQAPAPPAAAPAASDPVAELGDRAFRSPLLGEDGATSCATCHDPKRSFADGKADSIGALRIGIGRNSPTMFAIAKIERFRDPEQSVRAAPGRAPRTLNLEERALAPIANGLEMGSSVDAAVERLRKADGWNAAFDAAFGGGKDGATKARLGRALAAYLKTLEPPATPYAAYLAGRQEALSPAARAGLEVFRGAGRCDACHSGPALSDGLMHVVDPPAGPRIEARKRASAERHVLLVRREYESKPAEELLKKTPRELQAEADRKARELPGGGGYDAEQLEVQTTPLWDVARTGPWFRDGSADDLHGAVTTHVRELREIAVRESDVKAALAKLDAAGKRAPIALRPKRPAGAKRPTPDALTDAQLSDVVAFLRALSP